MAKRKSVKRRAAKIKQRTQRRSMKAAGRGKRKSGGNYAVPAALANMPVELLPPSLTRGSTNASMTCNELQKSLARVAGNRQSKYLKRELSLLNRAMDKACLMI